MFNYDVLSEDEALQERFQLLPDGEYDAVVDDSTDKISQSGNPMMELNLSVYDKNGRAHKVIDYLVFTRGMMWKVIHCADSAGLSEEYKNKKLCSDTIRGSSVKVFIKTEKGAEIPFEKLKGKPVGSRYSDKNKVEDYIKIDNQNNNSGLKNQNEVKEDFFNDDVPF